MTLTSKRPVAIQKDSWPVIAAANEERDHSGRALPRRFYLTVRQHQDGRTLVYGRKESDLHGEKMLRAGELLEVGADIPTAILRVSEDLEASNIAQRCIADLPAVPLD